MNKKCRQLFTKEQERLLKLIQKFEFFKWYVRYVGNRSGTIVIKGRCEASMLATLCSTEVTKSDVQKGSRKMKFRLSNQKKNNQVRFLD